MNGVLNSEKKHVVFIGKKTVGKSSLISALTRKDPGTVNEFACNSKNSLKKSVKLPLCNEVDLTDSAGIEDGLETGIKKINKTIKAITGADFAVVVLDARDRLMPEEVQIFRYLQKISTPYIIVVNKIEFGVNPLLLSEIKWLHSIHFEVSCAENVGIEALKRKLLRMLQEEEVTPIISDLLCQGDVVVLVIPHHSDSLQSRTVVQQIKTIKEALEEDTIVVVVSDTELRSVLYALKNPPDLVVTDGQSLISIAEDLPETVRLTTFPVLMARHKADLHAFIKGLQAVESLDNGDKVLIAEACTHHNQDDDMSREKIPRLLKRYTKKDINFKIIRGGDFPDDISDYKLIVHCEGCMLSRQALKARIKQAVILDIPIINYGIFDSFIHGAIPRALEPFAEAVNQI